MTFDRLPDLDNANVGRCFFTFFSEIQVLYLIFYCKNRLNIGTKFYSDKLYFRRITYGWK